MLDTHDSEEVIGSDIVQDGSSNAPSQSDEVLRSIRHLALLRALRDMGKGSADLRPDDEDDSRLFRSFRSHFTRMSDDESERGDGIRR